MENRKLRDILREKWRKLRDCIRERKRWRDRKEENIGESERV